MAPRYWLTLFKSETWAEFLSQEHPVAGFTERRRATVETIKEGDLLLCYLTGESRWVGVAEVTGKPFFDDQTRLWDSGLFPARVPVDVRTSLAPENGVPILDMRDRLDLFQNLSNPN